MVSDLKASAQQKKQQSEETAVHNGRKSLQVYSFRRLMCIICKEINKAARVVDTKKTNKNKC
jgi:hypothetical protein